MTSLDEARSRSPGLASGSTTTVLPASGSYVDWAAILAGTVVAVAISTLMTTFGAAIGLSATSPYEGEGISATALGIATAIYVVWVVVSSFLAGGYLAGRLRRSIPDTNEHEREMRDGSHGLVVWALGAILLAWLATSSVTGAVKAGAQAATTAASGAGEVLKSVTQNTNPIQYAVDQLVRGGNGGANPGAEDALRKDVMSVVGHSLSTGSFSDADKAYLTSRIAAGTGISQEEATRRVNDGIAQLNSAYQQLKATANKVRKTGILVGFLTAASLAVGAAAAWWAATAGGSHRDENVVRSPMTRWS